MSPCLRRSSRLIATRRRPPEKRLQTRSEVALAGVAAELVAGQLCSVRIGIRRCLETRGFREGRAEELIDPRLYRTPLS
ncbi:hypothetical protein Taro_004228 [Colocasia esculenta]|uniref:Uncharacterized protein n=1 Tax=Colocasia esculenta TaxID=4460 RepID=A0A843TJC2_COLES|nr:hypothetical protein [Colocasia esculenta]